ncbi:MAG TPA: ADP-ribosylglycohydrolase family protein [Candidatus Fimadaptatus faecigallinarum]|uniref:ADP-ribosylglycohydrolase family protein n=1 Tax=Candidatus Fimadaptatus faecigallinarum TaxID=2840814 RepID=A0A9D1LSN2_9FIRM|nr:ADP-ribosylglycohydrolase family protein [Candidatus Fimadaptatus faecigallinarum]
MRLSMDVARGALYGVAVADALGATLEFMSAAEIARRYGTLRDIVGGGWLALRPGQVTDDTEMTLAVAEGIAEQPDAPVEAVGRRFIEWLDTQPRDVGRTCAVALNYARRRGWADAARFAHDDLGGRSAGNGSLMRSAYPGLWYADRAQALRVAVELSRMTHYDPLASEACELYTAAIWDMARGGVPARQALKAAFGGTRYQAALAGQARLDPTGFVVDTLNCALDAVACTSSLEDAIVRAVNLGGDADTVGAVAGGLAGAMYGYDSIPTRWREALDVRTRARLDAAAERAVNAGADLVQ